MGGRNNRPWLWIAAAVLVSGLAGCHGKGLTFSVQPCDQGIDAYSPPTQGILSSTWLDEHTLVVEGFVKTFCSGALITGDYTIDGDHLSLTYRIRSLPVVTSCACAKTMEYRISELEQHDYQVTLTESSTASR